MLWLKFVICSSVILFAGSRLSIYAEDISKRTAISASMMGVVILAFITSCPELVTSLTSLSASVNAPDLAAGDLLGANIYNMLIIALLGMLSVKGSLLRGLDRGSRNTAWCTIIMFVIVVGAVLLYNAHYGGPLGIFRISFGSILLATIYIAGTACAFRRNAQGGRALKREKLQLVMVLKFAISAIIIIGAGIWLAHIGKAIAVHYNLSEMYVGALLIAFATTMPECVVSFTALKLGSVPMAAGNLLGSNFFNLFILAMLDIFFRKGEIFRYITKTSILPASIGLLLTVIALAAMTAKTPAAKSKSRIAWDSAAIVLIFLIGHIALFYVGK